MKKAVLVVPSVLRTPPLRTLLPSPSPVSSPPEHLHNWMENIILCINTELLYFLKFALREWRNKLLYILQVKWTVEKWQVKCYWITFESVLIFRFCSVSIFLKSRCTLKNYIKRSSSDPTTTLWLHWKASTHLFKNNVRIRVREYLRICLFSNFAQNEKMP